MKKFSFLALALAFPALSALAADPELTNYKSGIDVIWGVGDGSDKGTAYQEEYWFHDKLINDTKTVFLRSNTQIRMDHNERNVAATTGRPRVLIGAHGKDGAPNTGDEGQIRFQVDKIWNETPWSRGTNRKAAYTGPFTLAQLTYEAGVPVVGTTGAKPGTAHNSGSFYWRGMLDSVGDEWHVLMYADDDEKVGSSNDDAWASDGKYVLLVVNPKTPCLTVRSSGNGQFYTTPAWTYWTHKIHDQTTYIQPGTGSVTLELRNIYNEGLAYRINGGAVVTATNGTTTLQADAFRDGSNTLEYWYAATPSVVRTRKVVKNPAHPSLDEGHGARIWGGEAAWTAFRSRATREPYASIIASAQTDSGAGHSAWDGNRRQARRFGGSNWPYRNSHAGTNAMLAKYLGFSATRSGAARSYADYAKEMLLESALNQHPVGMEANFWASDAIPSADLYYRGYWDVDMAYSAATAYDVLIGGYRSDQHPNGITPIEDLFIRDRLADYVHQEALFLGGFAEQYLGMWSTCRHVGALALTIAMPNYSTPYFGTSGMNGNTQVHPWAPFRVYNYTWKALFVDHSYTRAAFTEGPMMDFGMEGSVASGALIRPPGTDAVWVDKVDYASFSQCGNDVYYYANLQAIHAPGNSRPGVLNFIDQITQGTLKGGKTPIGPVRQHAITVLNSRFPTAVANARAWVQSLPATDPNSEATALRDAGLGGLIFYDDGRGVGSSDSVQPTVAITLPTTQSTYSTTVATLALSGTASDNVGVTSVTWSNSAGGSGTATGTTSWSVPSLTLQAGTNTLTVTARDAAGNQASTSLAVTYTGVALPAAPVISPAGGNFAAPQTVTLTTATSGASIYFTTDGSTPSTTSTRYSTPLTISAKSTVKAIAATSATNMSPVATASFTFDEYVSSATWQSVALPSAQTGRFTVSWIATPDGDAINAVSGLSSGPATSYGQLACIVRFNDDGFIDARSGSQYIAEQSLPYRAGTAYRVSMTVDIAAKTYDVIVTPAGGSPVIIAVAYGFRTEQAAVTKLDHLSFFSGTGAHALGEIVLGSASGPPVGPTGLQLTP